MTSDPATLAAQYVELRDTIGTLAEQANALANENRMFGRWMFVPGDPGSDPSGAASRIVELRDISERIKIQADEIRDRLKGTLLGEATAPPEGGWVYGPVTVQYVKASERTSINRRKLVQQGVTLEQIEASMDVTKMPPTIRVVKTPESELRTDPSYGPITVVKTSEAPAD
ncbi:MAG TPA: hypothetical protein VJZ25_03100 [Gemmatimonadaceae bacterium]|nr:hypothetical protein [Gemmatimonadaceae bacterium]